MAKFLDEQTTKQLNDIFSNLENTVTLVRFSKNDCENCSIVEKLFNELAELDTSLKVTTFNIDENPEVKKQYDVNDAPSYVVLDGNNNKFGATFYGVPAGHEFNTLVTSISDAGSSKKPFSDKVINTILEIDKPVDIKIFVQASCPICPTAAINVSRLAQINKNITTTIYEAQTFDAIAEKYNVTGVPKTVINETKELSGSYPIEEFIEVINNL